MPTIPVPTRASIQLPCTLPVYPRPRESSTRNRLAVSMPPPMMGDCFQMGIAAAQRFVRPDRLEATLTP